ncbi:hypothetical protein EV702DRAFT_1144084 [Suillus placidus]|uniref:Secreted protein n=1 Tax=Suillus placidus TaxID=48579 RepID=A0A9P6ZJB8_9AGAM|nr:hypothetical protein EV702DRAFT_1144084 [Suillus placidus]
MIRMLVLIFSASQMLLSTCMRMQIIIFPSLLSAAQGLSSCGRHPSPTASARVSDVLISDVVDPRPHRTFVELPNAQTHRQNIFFIIVDENVSRMAMKIGV